MSSKDVVTLKIVLAYRWGLGDVDVHCIASSEDVATLRMLLRCRCCYVEDVVRLDMLLRARCCYVEDVVTLKMSNGFVDVKRNKAHVHFIHGSLVDYDIFMSVKGHLKFQKTRNS